MNGDAKAKGYKFEPAQSIPEETRRGRKPKPGPVREFMTLDLPLSKIGFASVTEARRARNRIQVEAARYYPKTCRVYLRGQEIYLEKIGRQA